MNKKEKLNMKIRSIGEELLKRLEPSLEEYEKVMQELDEKTIDFEELRLNQIIGTSLFFVKILSGFENRERKEIIKYLKNVEWGKIDEKTKS